MSPKEREEAAGVLDFQIRSGSKILGFDKEPRETNRRCIFSLICEIFPLGFVLCFVFWFFIIDSFALVRENYGTKLSGP